MLDLTVKKSYIQYKGVVPNMSRNTTSTNVIVNREKLSHLKSVVNIKCRQEFDQLGRVLEMNRS